MVLSFVLAGFVAAAVFGPPDPVTQILVTGAATGIGVAVGYVVAYGSGLLDSESAAYR